MADTNFKSRRLQKKALRDAVLGQVIDVLKRFNWGLASESEFQDAIHELWAVCTTQERQFLLTALKTRRLSH